MHCEHWSLEMCTVDSGLHSTTPLGPAVTCASEDGEQEGQGNLSTPRVHSKEVGNAWRDRGTSSKANTPIQSWEASGGSGVCDVHFSHCSVTALLGDKDIKCPSLSLMS